VFSGVLISEEVDGLGDEESGITTDTLGGLFFLHFLEICLFHE
jgi:hypothetical protein